MTTQPSQGRRPDQDIYFVVGEGKTARWTRIGAGWKTRDGKGSTMQLTLMPVGNDGKCRLVMRDIDWKARDAKREEAREASAAAPSDAAIYDEDAPF